MPERPGTRHACHHLRRQSRLRRSGPWWCQETLSDDFLQEVTAKGEYLRGAIEALDLPCFGKTRGLGLMIGIEVKEGYTNKEIAGKLIENGLLVLTAGPGMRLLPPLVISKEEMDQGVAIMKKVLG